LNRFRNLQIFQCRECLHKYTAAAGKNKTYTPRVILDSVSTYNLGNSVSDTQRVIRKRLHIDIPEGTIRSWIRAHKPLTAYARLRALGQKLFKADEMIRSYLLQHKQVYRFQVHRAKLELLLLNVHHRHLVPARGYLEKVGEDFPHGMFQTSERINWLPCAKAKGQSKTQAGQDKPRSLYMIKSTPVPGELIRWQVFNEM
jgi:hypothetical protein